MKKIYSFVFAAIAILSAASCQKELVNAPEADTNAAPFSFVAEREAETKTVLVDGKSTWWTPGDKVSAFDSKGEAVTFATNITENSASALFACELFSLPEDLIVHAIYPDRAGVSTLKDGIINNLRVAGSQQAVAGSFDPIYAVASAKGQITSMESAPELTFTNIHSLVKFTIGGDKVPSTVTLSHTGYYNLAGLYTYNTETGRVTPGDGAKSITLKPAAGESFEIGKTIVNKMTLNSNISSVRQAAALLGQLELKKWINTAVTKALCSDKPSEIMRISMIRARFAETLASQFYLGMETEELL